MAIEDMRVQRVTLWKRAPEPGRRATRNTARARLAKALNEDATFAAIVAAVRADDPTLRTSIERVLDSRAAVVKRANPEATSAAAHDLAFREDAHYRTAYRWYRDPIAKKAPADAVAAIVTRTR